MSQTYFAIDDLDEPQLPQRLRGWARQFSLPDVLAGLDVDVLLDRAREATGLHDTGDDWFREPLDVLCRAVRDEAGLSTFGALTIQQQLVALLEGRLRVEALNAAHPEIAQLHLDAPVVVAGLPRSGTTFLHGLLGADARLRRLAPDETTGPPAQDGGSGPSDSYGQVLEAGLPHMKRMLPLDEETTHEEIRLLGLSFASVLFETQVPLPSYRDWYLATDQTPAYAYLARTLRTLQFLRPATVTTPVRGGGGRRWVLKTMQHVEQLPALMATFPDAVVVRTHRDPASVALSISTMLSYGQRLLTDTVDPRHVGSYWSQRVVGMTLRCLRDRGLVAPDRVVDVTLDRIRDDPDGVVARVQQAAGLAPTEQATAAMAALRAERHPHRFGRIRYEPAASGVDMAAVRAATVDYRDAFGVRVEACR